MSETQNRKSKHPANSVSQKTVSQKAASKSAATQNATSQKAASQKAASQKAASQKTASQKAARKVTPDREPVPINQDDSRDELARTFSGRQGRRRKRVVEEDETDDEDLPSPSSLQPLPRKSANATAKHLAPTSSTAPAKSVSVPTPKPSDTRMPKASTPSSRHRSTTNMTASSQRRPATIDVPSSSRAANNGKSSYAVNSTTSSRPTANSSSSRPASTPKASARSNIEDNTQRRRSASSTTLVPGSNEQSQSHASGSNEQSQSHENVTPSQWISNGHIRKKVKLATPAMEKTEEAAWAELNLLTRRWFLAYLSNTNIDEPVIGVFDGMRHDHQIYKEAKQRVSRMYKTWKNQVLKAAEAWVSRWIASARPARSAAIANITSFKEFRRELRNEFDVTWLLQIFRFGVEAVDFEQILPDGIAFLRYAFLQIVTHVRFTVLHEDNPLDPAYIKYTRPHLLAFFDALHQKDEFHDTQSIDLYPERIIPRGLQHKRRQKLDINQDSDASLDDSDDGTPNAVAGSLDVDNADFRNVDDIAIPHPADSHAADNSDFDLLQTDGEDQDALDGSGSGVEE